MDLKEILQLIEYGTITEYGIGLDKEYCFVSDEDGYLVFLKRNDDISEHQKYLNKNDERRQNWPENSYDGEILWRQHTLDRRGLTIAEMFMKALEMEYQG